MKNIDYLLPEMSSMVKLLKTIEKYSEKINKIKGKIRKVEDISKAVSKIQDYNLGRFAVISFYQEICNKLYDKGKDFTYSLYQERFDEDWVKACFLDEANCLSLVKSAKIPGWDCNPSSPNFGFYLDYFILETLSFDFSADFVRDCMDYFVSSNRVLEQYRQGVMNLFRQKKKKMMFSDGYEKSESDDLLMAVNSVFSMKCGPNDYIPMFEPMTEAEFEAENMEAKNKRENSVLRLTKEDLERFSGKFKNNPFGKER